MDIHIAIIRGSEKAKQYNFSKEAECKHSEISCKGEGDVIYIPLSDACHTVLHTLIKAVAFPSNHHRRDHRKHGISPSKGRKRLLLSQRGSSARFSLPATAVTFTVLLSLMFSITFDSSVSCASHIQFTTQPYSIALQQNRLFSLSTRPLA